MRLSQSIPPLLIAAALGLVPGLFASFAQDEPKPVPPGEQGYPWNKISKKQNEELLDKLVGPWKLTRIISKDLNATLREETGVLLFTRDYASFELHIGWNDPLGGLADWQFQSGTHRVVLDAQSVLQLVSVIGSAFDEDGELAFEAPGKVRAFRVEVASPRLVLTRVDTGDRFEFRRMPSPSLDGKKDVYGRPKPEPEEEENE